MPCWTPGSLRAPLDRTSIAPVRCTRDSKEEHVNRDAIGANATQGNSPSCPPTSSRELAFAWESACTHHLFVGGQVEGLVSQCGEGFERDQVVLLERFPPFFPLGNKRLGAGNILQPSASRTCVALRHYLQVLSRRSPKDNRLEINPGLLCLDLLTLSCDHSTCNRRNETF